MIVLVFDALGRDVLLRAGEIDAARFPSLASLGAEGLVLLNASTASERTCEALPTMLRGVAVRAPECTEPLATAEQVGLLHVAAERYRVTVFHEWLLDCGPGVPFECRGVSHLIAGHPHRALVAHWLPRPVRARVLGPLGAEVAGGSLTTFSLPLFGDLLRHLEDAGASDFVVAHVVLPHRPYIFHADGTGQRGEGGLRFVDRLPEDDPATYQRYVRQTMFVDALVGRLVAALRERGLYEDATIVVTSDHGPQTFAEWKGPTSQETPWVPVIIRSPHLRPADPEVDYEHVDLAPTLVDMLGLAALPESQGVSIFALERPSREKRFELRGTFYVYDGERWVEERSLSR